jgi:hypothetical protein
LIIISGVKRFVNRVKLPKVIELKGIDVNARRGLIAAFAKPIIVAPKSVPPRVSTKMPGSLTTTINSIMAFTIILIKKPDTELPP